jgi:formylmethanofuran dehydrogenase subunit E
MTDLKKLLNASASLHSHLCPRQILGVRAALLGADILELKVPRRDKRLLVISETDGCYTDGIRVVTGVSVGHRTMRIEDYGKTAATFIDVKEDRSIRIFPRPDIRERAWDYTPGERRHYFSQLRAYQIMPPDALFKVLEVQLNTPLDAIISRAGLRTNCEQCGEEIINEREICEAGKILCRSCAGQSYYSPVEEAMHR